MFKMQSDPHQQADEAVLDRWKNQTLLKLRSDGPNRVMTNTKGYSINRMEAKRQGLAVDVICVTSDGWSIGAPAELEQNLLRLNLSQWVAMIRTADWLWTDL
jgi:hypothetical protein